MAPTLSRHLALVSASVLLGGLPSLWRSARASGRRCLNAQLQVAFLFWLARRALRGRLGQLEALLESSTGSLALGAVVPSVVFAGLALRDRRWLLRALIYGSAPTLAAAIDEVFGEDVDTIALMALELGLLMREDAAAAVILIMLSGGEALESYAFARARGGLKHVMECGPLVVHRMLGEAELEDVDVGEVKEGDVLLVRAGEVVPVDGSMLAADKDEVAVVDEGLLTGETGGTAKRAGDTVLSGTVARAGLRLRATAAYAGSTLALMRQALHDALERKGQLQQRSARAAALLKPLTLAVAAAALVLRRGKRAQRRWSVVLSVLMAATPCPASIGVPVAFLSGMSVAARHGVLIKSGKAIEAIAEASHVVLDKTGTLTRGSPVVRSFAVCTASKAARLEALQLVASVELLSTHPLAEALCRYAQGEGVKLLPAESPEHVFGSGVSAVVGGRRVVVGTADFVKAHGLQAGCTSDSSCSDPLLEVHFGAEASGHLPAVSGLALLEDPVREGAPEALEELRKLGLDISILSGDRSAHLHDVARQVGVQDARGSCLPADKAKLVQELAALGKVIMVGDESNDAPALAAAHVGISVGTSGLASQSADVVVAEHPSAGALQRVAPLVTLSRAVVATARRGVSCGLGLSAVQVACAGTGLVRPKTNAIMQELVDFSALVNSASVLRHRWQ